MFRMLFLGVIALAYAAACWLSPFAFWMTDLPRVEKVAELPDTVAGRLVAGELDENGIFFKTNRPELHDAPSKVAIGYSFREFEVLKLPLMAYPDYGYVLYSESREAMQLRPLDAAGQHAIAAKIGNDPIAAYRFPWWRYLWGLTFVAAMLVWLFFQFRHEARRRASSGIL